ncbi:PIN domain-containing protein [Aliihoeflea aestuarii]|jgi:ribonuclease VapC|uniref:type II toxin-antitoxin system VapC family toxin n=1 Tax=Aliihoeflea aestuarii TaxID=453840 RepID=UPI0020954313|nr:type II toxin-antitoxin system VapC family toxin [Aliihoeflea aestuarii]MCO6393342.1 PIN domain-containing protein [Aliihoeflea aestuarii]
MVVDTSAIVAILRAEDEAEAFALALGTARGAVMGASTYLEAGLVMTNDKSPRGLERLNILIDKADIEIVPTTPDEAIIGIAAHRNYGKGTGHPAKLNFGDCFSYALAKSRNLPLLFKGDDFIHTDIEPAVKPA